MSYTQKEIAAMEKRRDEILADLERQLEEIDDDDREDAEHGMRNARLLAEKRLPQFVSRKRGYDILEDALLVDIPL